MSLLPYFSVISSLPVGGGPGIAFFNLGTSAAPDFNQGSGSSHVTASRTPPAGLNLLGIASRHASGPIVPTVTGNSMTWVQIATVTVNSIWRLTLFAANGSGATAGATTISWAAQGSQVSAMGTFSYATGVDLTGGVAAAFVQAPTNFDAGTPFSLTVNLAAAGSASNRPFAVFFRARHEDAVPRTNWTELDDMTTANFRGLQSQYRADAMDSAASVSWSVGSACAGIAVEIKAA